MNSSAPVEEQVCWTGVTVVDQSEQANTVCDGPVDCALSSLHSKPVPVLNRFAILSSSEEDSPRESSSVAVDVCSPLPCDVSTVSPQSTAPSFSCRKTRQTRSSSPDQASTCDTIQAFVHGTNGEAIQSFQVENPPSTAEDLCSLPVISFRAFLKQLKDGDFEQVCLIVGNDRASEDLFLSSTMDPDHKTKVSLNRGRL